MHQDSHDFLIHRLRTATLQLKYHIAASRVMHFAFKAGFHADQPRVPRGSPDGGQWILVGKRPWRVLPRRPVDLQMEEMKGGHAVARHVGKSDEYLINRITTAKIYVGTVEVRDWVVSTFNNLTEAKLLRQQDIGCEL